MNSDVYAEKLYTHYEKAEHMRTKIFMGLILALGIMSLTGCSMFKSKIPELTQEQHDMVVEYATETLLHYDPHNGDKVGDFDESMNVEEEPQVNDTIAAEVEELPSEEGTDVPNNDEDTDIFFNADEISEIEEADAIDGISNRLEDILGLDSNISIEYKGYDVKKTYNETLDSFFVLSATDGSKLLILNFDVINNGNTSISVDMLEKKCRYKITLNGKNKNALSTFEPSDLAVFAATIEPSEKQSVAVIGEYKEEEISDIQTVGLVCVTSDGSVPVALE